MVKAAAAAVLVKWLKYAPVKKGLDQDTLMFSDFEVKGEKFDVYLGVGGQYRGHTSQEGCQGPL